MSEAKRQPGRHTKPVFLSEGLPMYPRATLYFGMFETYKETQGFDLSFELRAYEAGTRFLAVEWRRDEKRARHGYSLFGADSNVVIVQGWPDDYFETHSPFDENSERDPEPLFHTPEQWRAAFDDFLQDIRKKGHEVLGDFRRTELMHHLLLGKRLEGSRPDEGAEVQKSEVGISSLEDFTAAEEIGQTSSFMEGAATTIVVNKYERDREARRRCIEHYGGYLCQICEINLAQAYPGIGSGNFIHVHHLVPLSKIRQTYKVDPVRDLLPVCPNCHAMVHRKDPPYEPNDLRKALGLAPKSFGTDDVPF